MGDSYLEVLVERKTGSGFLIGRNILVGLGAVSFILGLFSSLFIILVPAAIILFVLAWLCNKKIYIEYEYLYLDKTLTIDRISNRSSRKKMAEYNMGSVELFAPASSHRLDNYSGSEKMKTVDFSSGEEESEPYAMIVREGGKLIRVLLEASDRLYDQIRTGAPGKVFKD